MGECRRKIHAEEDEKRWYRVKLEEILRRKETWIRVDDFDMGPGCPPGENFVGDVVRVVVYGRKLYLGAWTDIRKSLIVKRVPEPGSPVHMFHDCSLMFRNEIVAYEHVLPMCRTYLARKSRHESVELSFPEFYGRCRRFLVLQDLQTAGYQVVNRVKGFSAKECSLILQELSKFHALSFALKNEHRALFLKTVGKLKETIFCEEHAKKLTGIFWENSIKFAIKSLNESEDPRLRKTSESLKLCSGQVFRMVGAEVRPDSGKFDVVCHGDLWSSNILLRYCESGYPIAVKFIDLQAMRYSSCVLDVMHILFTSSRPGIYRTYLAPLLSEYYDSLASNLKNLDAVPDFTFDEFMSEFKSKIFFGVVVSCLMFTCVTRPSTPEPSDAEENLPADPDGTYASLGPGYHERLRALFLALADYNLI